MRRTLALCLVLASAVPPAHRAWAAGKDKDEEEESDDSSSDDDESSDDESSDDEDEGSAKEKASSKDKDKSKSKDEDEEDAEPLKNDGLRDKQDLTGHDLGTQKKANEFERDRFFVDKVDTDKTENGTLIQGSIASSSFFYKETGGAYPTLTAGSNTGPSRLFTELRLQTDFRHIKASRWDARIDTRGRLVNSIDGSQPGAPSDKTADHIQSGLTGQNEYELREAWVTRVGKRSDIFIGRQFIPDLGAVKIDGMRVDYAKSAKLTLIFFGGLFPLRGSRSVTTDYKSPFVVTGGFGGAYRSVNAYGSLGGVAQVPVQQEQPRIFVTSSGYLRSGPKVDFYHFVIVDLIGAAAQQSTGHIGLTNVSAGVNLKPDQRLRITANVNRVDTETLNVQAQQFLSTPDTNADPMKAQTYGGNKVVQNEAFLQRLATEQARLGVSAGLGKLQRFEVSTSLTYRQRQEFTLTTPAVTGVTQVALDIPAASSVEVWGSIVDRRSIKQARIGLDIARSFGVGKSSYQRSNTQTIRLFVLRDFHEGRGEFEGEGSYAKVLNDAATMPVCPAGTMPIEQQVATCYGNANNTLISAGGQVVYRLKTDWLGIANLYVLRTTNRTPNGMGGVVTDPAVLGLTGFIRIAKRF